MTMDTRFPVTVLFLLLWIAALWPAVALPASEYHNSLATQVASCQEIDADEYQTGLLFNPDGYRSYYLRSACLQRLAVEYRNPDLCQEVKRRRALFSSSWGYSTRNCQLLVAQKLTEDRNELQTLRQTYLAAPMSVSQLTVESNGNGRDFDFIPRFNDGMPYGYNVDFQLVDNNGDRHVILEYGGYLAGSDSNIRLFLTRQELLARFPSLAFNRPYAIDVIVSPSLGLRKLDGWLRPDILEQDFPYAERNSIRSFTVIFAD